MGNNRSKTAGKHNVEQLKSNEITSQEPVCINWLEILVVYFIKKWDIDLLKIPQEIVSLVVLFANCSYICYGNGKVVNNHFYIKSRLTKHIKNGYKSITRSYDMMVHKLDNTLWDSEMSGMHHFNKQLGINANSDYIRYVSELKGDTTPSYHWFITKTDQLYRYNNYDNNNGVIHVTDCGFHKLFISSIYKIKCSSYHSIFLSFNGNVYVFGQNDAGQCGVGRNIKKVTNVQLLESFNDDVHIIDIVIHKDSNLCLSKDGKVYGFGANYLGQLGLSINDAVIWKPYQCKYFMRENIKIAKIDTFLRTAFITDDHDLYIVGDAYNNRRNQQCISYYTPSLVKGFKVKLVCCAERITFFLTYHDKKLYEIHKFEKIPKLSNWDIDTTRILEIFEFNGEILFILQQE